MEAFIKFGVGLVAVAALALGIFLYTHPSAPQTQTTPPVGATPGADSQFACESHNGVQRCFNAISPLAASTTVCAIKSPSATSTLVSGGFRFGGGTTTASVVTMARATTPYATTTILGSQIAIAANAAMTALASTTSTTGGNTIFPPNTYFVVGQQGGLGTFSPSGVCQATFETF